MVSDVVLAATRKGQPIRQSAAHVNGSCTAGELSTAASMRLRRRTLLVVLLFLLLLGNRSAGKKKKKQTSISTCRNFPSQLIVPDTGRQREGTQRTPPGHLFPQLLLLVEQLRIHFYAPSAALRSKQKRIINFRSIPTFTGRTPCHKLTLYSPAFFRSSITSLYQVLSEPK